MYDCVACTLSSITSIAQLGLTPHDAITLPIFTNGHPQFLKRNLKYSILKSTRRQQPLSWDEEFLFQKPTSLEEKRQVEAPPPAEDGGGGLGDSGGDGEEEELLLSIKGEERVEEEIVRRSRTRKSMKRSNMLAKQVISVDSALSLGFVSQLWVDVSSWRVMVVELRPNLLSGEPERLLLEDIMQVGDVVLVEDESVVENEFKLVGLETLVGYNVITPTRRKIGKVRGYSFNVDSGSVKSLELDSFGISVIPSSLVATYALFIEDVLEVGSDTVVVHEAAPSHVQRLTKGLLGTQTITNFIPESDEYPEPKKRRAKAKSGHRSSRNLSGQKTHPEMAESADDWELPMDYL